MKPAFLGNFVTLFTIPSGPVETNAYIIACNTTHVAAIIDPAPGSSRTIEQILKQYNLLAQSIILTHSHWDHFADAKVLQDSFNIPLFVHEDDAFNVRTPGADGLPMFFTILSAKMDKILKDKDTLQIGNTTWEIIHTPGHSLGSICLYNRLENLLLSGDTLFKGSIGRLDFPTSSSNHMWLSLEKLNKLPQETRVFPGHGKATTIGNESWLSRAKEIWEP